MPGHPFGALRWYTSAGTIVGMAVGPVHSGSGGPSRGIPGRPHRPGTEPPDAGALDSPGRSKDPEQKPSARGAPKEDDPSPPMSRATANKDQPQPGPWGTRGTPTVGPPCTARGKKREAGGGSPIPTRGTLAAPPFESRSRVAYGGPAEAARASGSTPDPASGGYESPGAGPPGVDPPRPNGLGSNQPDHGQKHLEARAERRAIEALSGPAITLIDDVLSHLEPPVITSRSGASDRAQIIQVFDALPWLEICVRLGLHDVPEQLHGSAVLTHVQEGAHAEEIERTRAQLRDLRAALEKRTHDGENSRDVGVLLRGVVGIARVACVAALASGPLAAAAVGDPVLREMVKFAIATLVTASIEQMVKISVAAVDDAATERARSQLVAALDEHRNPATPSGLRALARARAILAWYQVHLALVDRVHEAEFSFLLEKVYNEIGSGADLAWVTAQLRVVPLPSRRALLDF